MAGDYWPDAIAPRFAEDESRYAARGGSDGYAGVRSLKAESGKTIVAFGGVGLAALLIENYVLDELQFYVNPVALGDGPTIFKEANTHTKLKLLGAQQYDCGMVVNHYAHD